VTFKLSAQLDDVGDPRYAFKLYESYIEKNKWRIPESALEIIAHPDWSGGSQSNAPYQSQVVSVQLTNLGSTSAAFKLTLFKEMYVEIPFSLEITYEGLFALNIPSQQEISESALIWRYDQFLYFSAYHSHEIKDKFFTHQIEWVGGSIWSITARNIGAQWKYS
jgi:hypothetical protein